MIKTAMMQWDSTVRWKLGTGRPSGLAGRVLVCGLSTVMLLALVGCNRQAGTVTPQSNRGAASGGPMRGGTLVTAWIAEPKSVNELIALPTAPMGELVAQLFPRLLQENSDSQGHPPGFGPSLATSYEWSSDHRTLTFHLRSDAMWSDGKPITAADVRWTWLAETSPDIGWAYAFMKSQISSVEVADDHTVRFIFRRVYSKQLLDANEGGILPSHAWGQLPFARWHESADWFLHNLVVSGPFTVQSWIPQQEIVLERNPRYFGSGLPYLDRVVFRIIPDQAAVLAQLSSGEIDFAPAISPDSAAWVAAKPDLRLLSFWYRSWVGIAWNEAHEPFSDPGVRRAMSLALDRGQIVATIWHRYARVADSPIPAWSWAHNPFLLPFLFDPDQARGILSSRGFAPGEDGVLRRSGKPLTFEIVTNIGNRQRLDALVMIQEQLRRIGVKALIREMDFNALTAEVEAGRFDAALVGTDIDTSLDLSAEFHSRSIGTFGNITHYSNPEVDRLIDHAMNLPDISAAKQDLYRIQAILQRDQPYTFLWESQRISAFNRRVHGIQPEILFSLWNLKDWWVEH